jgi:hypothetical protein
VSGMAANGQAFCFAILALGRPARAKGRPGPQIADLKPPVALIDNTFCCC